MRKTAVAITAMLLLASPVCAKMVNLWVAMSDQAVAEYRERAQMGEEYSGPMDDQTFAALSKMHDQKVVMGMFKQPTIGGKKYHLFSLYFDGTANTRYAVDKIAAQWPTHFVVVGAWFMDGRQVGTSYDGNGELVGDPVYPIHSLAYKFMPDNPIYDGSGNLTGYDEATSNADLRDVNVLTRQSVRSFE